MSRRRRSRQGGASALFNILTILVLVGVLIVGCVFITLFTNPQLNPIAQLRPIFIPTFPPTPSPTETSMFPPTFTPESTNTPLPTSTLRPSSTPIPTGTPFSLVTPPTSPPGTTPTPQFAYAVQPGNPIAIQNVTHPDLGCEWMGVGGQAIDLSGAPVLGLVVQLGGSLQGNLLDLLSLTGSAAQFGYGPGGYEFTLADEPITTDEMLYVQLLDQAGQPLSDRVFFDTTDSCEQNLVLINFTQLK